MRFILVLLLAFTLTPLASFADENRTVIDVYQDAIEKLDREYRKLKQLTTEARQKVAELEKETNSVKELIAKYEAALNTTRQELLAKHEAELKIIQEAYQAKLKAESDLAELARKSAENDAKATRTLFDELGTSAEQVAKLTDAVTVSKDGKVGIGTDKPTTSLEVNGNVLMTNNPYNRLRVTDIFDDVTIEFVKASNGKKAGAIQFNGWSKQTFYKTHILFSSRTNNGESYIWDMTLSDQGNVGIGTTTPGAKLDVAGNLIRTIAYATDNGPNDQTDNGQIKSRILKFNKTRKETKIRLSYTDNLRTLGTGKGCRWEIRVDGHSCPNQALVYDDYADKEDNTHSSRTVVGYCSGIATGSHTIGIWVSNVIAGSDCYTGWANSTWVIEAEEVN